jgi:pimeloyl-ACP methyl ester carboxylesterase
VTYLEYGDHPGIFVPHDYPEHTVDLGEIRMNYAVAGEPENPALLLIPGQSESWWGYEQAMALLAGRYRVYAVDLRGQGRSTWTPGRYSLDLFGGDLVRFIDRVIGRPVVVSGLSSGGVIAAWLSAFAAPGQVLAAVYEDPPLFASEVNPAVGHSIRQGAGPIFRLWHKWLGPQWSIGDVAGMKAAMSRELPGWISAALLSAAADQSGQPSGVPQNLDPDTGNLLGAISDQQAAYVRRLVEGTGNSFTYRAFPHMPHSMHQHDPAIYVATVTDWLAGLGTVHSGGPGSS